MWFGKSSTVGKMPTSETVADPMALEVRRHFESVAKDFDSIYSGRKSSVSRWLDQTFRKDMFQRRDAAICEIMKMGAVTVLDVGCGSGAITTALARGGAKTVVGVDFSQSMIELARNRAVSEEVSSRCTFIVGDFRLQGFPERFQCSLAVGVFDYLAEPQAFLREMRRVTSQKIIATFPYRWTYRAPIRKVRLALKGCPVYFYAISDVRRLFEPLKPARLTIRKLGKICFVVADF